VAKFPARRLPLPGGLAALRKLYGKPDRPAWTDPFQLILYENVAYLASDARRDQAFELLKKHTGLRPEEILAAPPATLREIAGRGILPAGTAEKLREIARIAVEEFGGDLAPALRLPQREAIRELRKFPSIGEPGAEKILLFTGARPILALESNGLRVLLRLGFGNEERSYAKSYRSAQEAASAEIPESGDARIEAHLLLRRHGQELCKRNHPRCDACPLRPECAYYRAVSG
jgi:endonuclease-3